MRTVVLVLHTGMYGVDGGTRVWVKYGTAFQRKDKHGDKLPEQLRRKPTLRCVPLHLHACPTPAVEPP